MRKALHWGVRGFTWLCTALVVLAGLTYVVGKVVGVPVRVTYQTVAHAVVPGGRGGAPQPAPPLPAPPAVRGAPAVQNVIFFVGDGMGLSMLAAVDALAERRLSMGRMPVTGLVRTASLSGLITDSAAGATAFATGHKTTNGTVSMTPEGQRLPTILEAAAAQGFATGLVTTSYLTDATPAGFAAHVPSRHDYGAIARQMIASRVDVLIGGTHPHAFTDSLRRAARQQRFAVSASLDALTEAPAGSTPRWLGLFPERKGLFDKMHGPPLAQTLQAVLAKLHRRGRRFFLVVEQEGTDAAGHTNRLQDARRYLRELDRAVHQALRFAARSGGRTLVLVTADHDTGGLSITHGSYAGGRATARWNTFGHTATWVPLLAYGPGAERFTGVQENTALPAKMARLLGLEGFSEKDQPPPR